jgi:hypothetical protein
LTIACLKNRNNVTEIELGVNYYRKYYYERRDKMKLTPPKKIVFWVATVLAALGLLASFVAIPFVSANAFWFVVVGFVLLWLGNTVKGF